MANFYSDTQTRASRQMRESILDIPLGDERHDEDPCTVELCARVAKMLGMEAAVFLPSGTMCNEIAIAVHCQPGDEVICTRQSHVIFAESGGPAALSGVMINPIDDEHGMMTPDQVRNAIRPNSSFAPRSRLLITEQTSNLGGGSIWPVEQLSAVAATAKSFGLATHLDGARLMNAVVASGISAKQYAQNYDSAWLGFTKGLGCPVGAVLAGSQEFIKRSWLFKRRWGGAMRQTGVLTAMCLYALDNNVSRLKDDHALAQRIGNALCELPLVERMLPIDTNIIIFDVVTTGPSARQVSDLLKQKGVIVTVVGDHRLRIVTHMDVDDRDGDLLIDAFNSI
ncbi:MAG: threonine aldolase [Paraglaciecola sp.]|jgi:threonine aldolase